MSPRARVDAIAKAAEERRYDDLRGMLADPSYAPYVRELLGGENCQAAVCPMCAAAREVLQ